MSQLPGKLRALHKRERHEDDWYVEPKWVVNKLFERITFRGTIHDPACGTGTIPNVAGQRGYRTTGADTKYRGWGMGGLDFLTDQSVRDNIISNPPYKLAEKFARHALVLTKGQVCLLVRLPFLAGQQRYDTLYKLCPPQLILVLSKRPSMPPGNSNSPARNGTSDYCWICWTIGYVGTTMLDWVK